VNENEIRKYWQVEIRAKSGNRLVGSIPYKSLSEPLYNGMREMLWPECFKKSIRENDIYFVLSHDAGKPIASTASGTLRLKDTAQALKFEVDLPDTTLGRDLYTDVKSGNFKKMSFGFNFVETDIEEVNGEPVNIVYEGNLAELSPVVWAAYSSTSLQARHLSDDINLRNLKNHFAGSEEKMRNEKEILDYYKNRSFENFGEFIGAVVVSGKNDDLAPYQDTRLATGLNETIGSEGGFLTPPGFSEKLLFGQYASPLIKSVLSLRIETPDVALPFAVSSDRSNGLYDGLIFYQVSEADEKTASFFRVEQIKPSLKKTVGLGYATDELFSDVNVLERWFFSIMSNGLAWELEDRLINGAGFNTWLGLLNAPAKIRVDKESGQSPATICSQNIRNMKSRLLPESHNSNGLWWIVNQTTLPQLQGLTEAVGTGGGQANLYQYKKNENDFDRLAGIPVYVSEHGKQLGTEGDLILADLAYYLFCQKAIRKQVSGHLRFVYDESAFRFILRSDGQPIIAKPVTPKNGNETLSPIITLQTRS
jgi:HK97 family phage major capsid protein/HK97 family phage prohead protease